MHPSAAGGFSSAAGTYARARPAYARSAIGLLKESVPEGPVLDLAAGTGILTGQLVRAGRDVVAVEPLVEMLAQLRLALPGVRAAAGTAEAVPARSDAFAGITVGQAFHWFDPADALAEAGRVLRPGGVLALLFNVRDESVGWVRAVTDLIELRSGGRPYSDHRERSWQSVVGEHGSFVPLCDRDFDNPVPSSPRGVLERVRSTSFVAVMEPGAREDLLREVAGVLETDPGTAGRDRFDYPHRTVVHLWTLGG